MTLNPGDVFDLVGVGELMLADDSVSAHPSMDVMSLHVCKKTGNTLVELFVDLKVELTLVLCPSYKVLRTTVLNEFR